MEDPLFFFKKIDWPCSHQCDLEYKFLKLIDLDIPNMIHNMLLSIDLKGMILGFGSSN